MPIKMSKKADSAKSNRHQSSNLDNGTGIATAWAECKLGDLVEITHGYAFKGEFFSDVPTDDILLTPGNFKIGGGFKADKFKYYKGDYPSEYILHPHDIVVTMTDLSKEADTLGYSAIVPEIKGKKLLHNQRIGRVKLKSDLADIGFINWIMRTAEYRWHIIGSASGSTVSHTSPTRILGYQFMLPPLLEQRAVSAVLSILEDKINILHCQNKTLEGLASTLWRKTFVENPDANWEETGLDKIAHFLNGLPCQKYPPKGASALPVIKIKELRVGITEDSDLAASDVPVEYLVEAGDILFSWSGSLDVVIWGHAQGVLNQHLFKVTSQEYPKWFCYFWIKHHLPEFQDIAQDKATTMGHIQRHHLSDAKVLIPDTKIFDELNMQFLPLFEKYIHNLKVIRRLASLRDALLPKLMSGEVRVTL